MSAGSLTLFVRDSNAIEGILRDPADNELEAHRRLLACDYLTRKSVEDFVFDICGKKLRSEPGMNVRVGPHLPPLGGPEIAAELVLLLESINRRMVDRFEAHVRYETLHPFQDGNGRSGRAIWAWMMQREGRNSFELPFLHRWYYDSLEASR